MELFHVLVEPSGGLAPAPTTRNTTWKSVSCLGAVVHHGESGAGLNERGADQ